MGAKKKRCCVPGCSVFAVTGNGKTVFHFPSDPKRLREWLRRVGKEALLREKLSTVRTSRFVCPGHFENRMFRDKFHNHLLNFAVPSIFPEGHTFLSDTQMASWDVFRSKDSLRSQDIFEFSAPVLPKFTVSILKPAPVPCAPHFLSTNDSAMLPVAGPSNNDSAMFPVAGPSNNDSAMVCEGDSPKRKRSVEDEDEVGMAEKCPRRDSSPTSLPRRSMESTGARERSPKKRVSIKQIASSAGVSSLSGPNEVRMAKKAQEYRQMALTFRRKLEVCRRKNVSLKKLASKRFIDMVDELQISPVTRQIVKAEMRNFKRKKKGRTWTSEDKMFCLAIYKRSTRSYRFMRQYMLLPCENTLKSLLDQVPLEPGISNTLLTLLSEQVKRMMPWDKFCVVSFDEVFLRGNLYFNQAKNVIEGYEDYGHKGRTNKVADHALVFMAQGLSSKWTFPVAYFLVSKTCPATMLKMLLVDVVKSLMSIGLTVFGSISDQGPTNQGAIAELKRETTGDTVFYEINGKRLVHIWDMPHILKNIRNNLLSSDLEFEGGTARWRQLIHYFKLDESLYKMSNLTYKHVNPQGRDKMKVSIAAETLSSTTSRAIKTFQALKNCPQLLDSLIFAHLCDQVDLFFDLCNGPRKGEKVKVTRGDVTATSLHHEKWPEISASLKKWNFIRKSDDKSHVPPCVTGWIQNIQSFQALWKKVENCGLNILKLRHLNQDPVENLFSLLRQCAGSATDLTSRTFASALKTTLVTRFASPVRDKNCLDDESFFVCDISKLLLSVEPTEGPAPNNEDCLIRGDTPQRKRIIANDPVERQEPTQMLIPIMTSISREIKCNECLSKLCTRKRSRDTMFTDASLALDLFPSTSLVTLYMTALSTFNQKSSGLLHKKNVTDEIIGVCNLLDWSGVFCPAHFQSDYKNVILEKVAVLLIKSKTNEVNRKFKEKVVRRSRQVMAGDLKNIDGLRGSEVSAEIHSSDLQYLLGPGVAFVSAEECSTPQRGSTTKLLPVGTPSRVQGPPVTPARVQAPPVTPARVQAPPVTPARATMAPPVTPARATMAPPVTPARATMAPPVTPVRATMAPPVTPARVIMIPPVTPARVIMVAPVTPARQKVLANWQPPPTPSTPMKTAETALSREEIKILADRKNLGCLTNAQLKQFLKDQKKRVGGNKLELIKRIETEVFNINSN